MICPDCGHDNIGGVDGCEHCGQDLRSIDVPGPKEGLQRRIMETPLRELVPSEALTARPDEAVAAVIRRMQENKQGSVMVVDQGRLVGIFTERDALKRLTGRRLDLEKLAVREVMTRDPRALKDDDTLAFALNRMAVGNYRHIPIVSHGKPLRFVSVRGVLRYLHEHAR